MRKDGPSIVSCLDGLIHMEVLKRATFPIKVSPHDSGCIEVHPQNQVELTMLYKEVANEILTQYGFQDE